MNSKLESAKSLIWMRNRSRYRFKKLNNSPSNSRGEVGSTEKSSTVEIITLVMRCRVRPNMFMVTSSDTNQRS